MSTSAVHRYERYSRRRRRGAAEKHQRLDIQGLRMVAVLTVFANHLWGWPRGGFVGVDVFFVISGFLITGNLLRGAEKTGNVSFGSFYWNRVRRIVPAATVVLILTWVASTLVFLPFRSHQVGIDAFFAFIFFANWHFAIQGTDYFNATEAVSPIQHYWSLSIEEQFYFVWPALIFLISLIILRKAWTHGHRMRIAGIVMGVVVSMSLAWAIYQTATSPAWAYFDTFSRVWELGVGALLATAVGALVRIPKAWKPVLSWAGLALIAVSLIMLADGAVGFPAPWAIVPVAGAALVIAAGVGAEPKHQAFLRNPVSGYIGDISYSLYLVHWPVIVILGAVIDPGPSYSVIVIAVTFALAIASYHFVENPLRRADWSKLRKAMTAIREGVFSPATSTGYAALAATTLLVVAAVTFTLQPSASKTPTDLPALSASSPSNADAGPKLGPLATALQGEITEALKTTEWPQTNPTMDAVAADQAREHQIDGCYGNDPLLPEATCAWGSPDAPIKVVIVGDSIAGTYAVPLREIANESNGRIHFYTLALGGCEFADESIYTPDAGRLEACPGRKQAALDFIKTTKPNVVIIANTYQPKRINGTNQAMTPRQWTQSMRVLIDQFRPDIGKLVLLAPPPAGPLINDCYGKRGSVPADCAGKVRGDWINMAEAEQRLAAEVNATWIDPRPWFCNSGVCPAFAGSTPTKVDVTHMTPAYGVKIHPVIAEALTDAGVL